LEKEMLVRDGEYLALPDRAHLPELRRGKEAALNRKWNKLKTHLPRLMAPVWVKGVLLTGSMAAGNAGNRDDIDLLLILDKRRMWLGYLLFRMAARRIADIEICPNYVISDAACTLPFPNLFTAVEWSMARPLKLGPALMAMEQANAWCRDYLPNLRSLEDKRVDLGDTSVKMSRWLTWFVFSPLGWLADRFEYTRLKWRTRGCYQPQPHIYKPHPPTRQRVIFENWTLRLDRYQLEATRVRRHIREQEPILQAAIANWEATPGRAEPCQKAVHAMVAAPIERPAPSAVD